MCDITEDIEEAESKRMPSCHSIGRLHQILNISHIVPEQNEERALTKPDGAVSFPNFYL